MPCGALARERAQHLPRPSGFVGRIHPATHLLHWAMFVHRALLLLCGFIGAAAQPTALATLGRNLARGAAFKCSADLVGGLPCAVWTSNCMVEARKSLAEQRGSLVVLRDMVRARGPRVLWSGVSARMVEGMLSGGLLLAAKEGLRSLGTACGLPPPVVAAVAGAGGGCAQAIVMAPCALLVTRTATGGADSSVRATLADALRRGGVRELYKGSGAVACRQATNWASRQYCTEFIRPAFGPGVGGELAAGVIGGAVSCWNTPFEVARVESVVRSAKRDDGEGVVGTMRLIVQERGPGGLFAGLLPRCFQAAYQTVFMVCVPRLLDSAR